MAPFPFCTMFAIKTKCLDPILSFVDEFVSQLNTPESIDPLWYVQPWVHYDVSKQYSAQFMPPNDPALALSMEVWASRFVLEKTNDTQGTTRRWDGTAAFLRIQLYATLNRNEMAEWSTHGNECLQSWFFVC